MTSSWETPPLAQFGNGIPHVNFSFHEQSNEFNPYRSSYQEVSFISFQFTRSRFRFIFVNFSRNCPFSGRRMSQSGRCWDKIIIRFGVLSTIFDHRPFQTIGDFWLSGYFDHRPLEIFDRSFITYFQTLLFYSLLPMSLLLLLLLVYLFYFCARDWTTTTTSSTKCFPSMFCSSITLSLYSTFIIAIIYRKIVHK